MDTENTSSQMGVVFVTLLLFSILGMILYNYRQMMTKKELIQFIFTACVASVLMYFKGILTDDTNYMPVVFLILFGFIYSMIDK